MTDVDWAGTLEGLIILNIDEPYKSPALRALERLRSLLLSAEEERDALRESAATNWGSLTRVLAQERRLCKTLDDIGRWLGHPAEPTNIDIQQVIAVIEDVRKGSPSLAAPEETKEAGKA